MRIILVCLLLAVIVGCREEIDESLAWRQAESNARAAYDTYMANHGKSDTLALPHDEIDANGDTIHYWGFIIEREPFPVDSTQHTIIAEFPLLRKE